MAVIFLHNRNLHNLPHPYYFPPYFLQLATTTPVSANRANALGITIIPLKKSDNSHTKSTFKVEPTTINTNTMQEYIFTAKSPKRYFTFTAPKNCQLKIVEKAKNSKQIATKISPNPQNTVENAAWVSAIPPFPVANASVDNTANTVIFKTIKVSINTLIIAIKPCS